MSKALFYEFQVVDNGESVCFDVLIDEKKSGDVMNYTVKISQAKNSRVCAHYYLVKRAASKKPRTARKTIVDENLTMEALLCAMSTAWTKVSNNSTTTLTEKANAFVDQSIHWLPSAIKVFTAIDKV